MGCVDGARQEDSGRRHLGLMVCQPPPPREALGYRMRDISRRSVIRLSATDQDGATCPRLGKMVLSYTGEILRRPTVGKSLL